MQIHAKSRAVAGNFSSKQWNRFRHEVVNVQRTIFEISFTRQRADPANDFPGAVASDIISFAALRARARSGISRSSHCRQGSPLMTIAASGWLISCAMEAASFSNVA